MASVLRGIRKRDWKKQNGVSALAFMPDDTTIAKRQARDASNHAETSINWEDDAGAVAQLVSGQSAQHGVARIDDIEGVKQFATERFPGCLETERAVTDTNKYHGNILFAADSRSKWMSVAQFLAALAECTE